MKNETPETSASLDTLMERLELIAKTLSEGSEPLESTLKQYEEGIHLARECLKRLDAAEQHVTELRKVLEENPPDSNSETGEIFPLD